MFASGSILLPWSNSITGPIDPIIESSNELVSGSGSGSINGSSINGTIDYCGQSLNESSVNENSITRIPAKVWAIVLLALLMQIIAR